MGLTFRIFFFAFFLPSLLVSTETFAGEYISKDAISTNKQGHYTYTLYSFKEYSSGACRPRGHCGCGVDEGIVWEKTNEEGKVELKKELTLSACSGDPEGDPTGLIVPDNFIRFSYHKPSPSYQSTDRVYHYVIYDLLYPELGFYEVPIDEFNNPVHKHNLAKIAREEIYIYPGKYGKPYENCDKSSWINRHKPSWGFSWSSLSESTQESDLKYAYDLNNDGKCEYFIVPRGFDGKPSQNLFHVYNNKGENIAGVGINFWLGESHNGYAQLLNTWNIGTYYKPSYTKVYVQGFERNDYRRVHSAEFSFYKKPAERHYKAGDYLLAEKNYLSLYRMKKEEDIESANDLALTWIKLKKYNGAEEILNKHINTSDDIKEKAKAYFSLGLIYESTNDFKKAFEAYYKSNELQSTTERKAKVLISKYHSLKDKFLTKSNPVTVPSFDCAKASTKVEKLICNDAELSKLDNGLGIVYSEARKISSDSNALKQQQLEWLKERNKCADKNCVRQKYIDRIVALEQITYPNKDH